MPSEALSLAAGPEILPLTPSPSRTRAWIAALVSLVLVAGVLWRLDQAGMAEVETLLHQSPLFWLAFVALYLAQPVSELLIYHRLWNLPLAGLPALMRKTVSNEILLGYSGEAYFYLWARDRLRFANAPFGAVRDVSVTSAIAGSTVTLAVLGAALPSISRDHLAPYWTPMLWAGAVLAVVTIAVLTLGRRVLSLRGRDLRFVMGTHLARMVVTTGLTLGLWALALPHVAFGEWLALAALRLLVQRLPLITNKDLLFADLAILAVGSGGQIGALMATLAMLMLGAHLAVMGVLAGADVLRAAWTAED